MRSSSPIPNHSIRLKAKPCLDPLEKSQTQRPRPRIESLADLVFGLALSISAIILVGNRPTTSAGLFEDIMTFALNFLILVSVWLNYTRVTSVLPIENTRTMGIKRGATFRGFHRAISL
jgi:hypothetical protein